MATTVALVVGSADTVGATLIGPNPAEYLRATPVFGLLVVVLMVSRATRYLPSMVALRLIPEKFVVVPTGVIRVQSGCKLSDAAVSELHRYQE